MSGMVSWRRDSGAAGMVHKLRIVCTDRRVHGRPGTGRFLGYRPATGRRDTAESLNIFLTSLGCRNVYSHRDPGFACGLLGRRLESLRCFLPASPESVAAVVYDCAREPGRVNCLIVDKYDGAFAPTGLRGTRFTLLRRSTRPAATELIIAVAGSYLVREGLAAAEAIATPRPGRSRDRRRPRGAHLVVSRRRGL